MLIIVATLPACILHEHDLMYRILLTTQNTKSDYANNKEVA